MVRLAISVSDCQIRVGIYKFDHQFLRCLMITTGLHLKSLLSRRMYTSPCRPRKARSQHAEYSASAQSADGIEYERAIFGEQITELLRCFFLGF